ncbi:unannotated protein [freshwater metagenome]|uniref:Unannotated protein n=1 Tax=freshwater metagenome TaxID=449393 RepID=A0A6J6N9T8_9ZZZZ|nr:hypothetical protein [Actinomycetota bacterium]MSW10884.1 hypothetical protein [Actinomycetota bacterium]MSY17171.1 hypothetical protein [Actinomycetota bacterium]MSY41914.1 hypothetical protein [Actinomycetota bacterium]
MANGIARPMGVTLVGVIIVISGLLGVLLGVLGLFNLNDAVGAGIWGVLVSMVIGIIYLLVAKGIFDGNRISRLIVAILTVINLLKGISYLFAGREIIVNGLIDIIVALIVLYLLYGGKARVFFASS